MRKRFKDLDLNNSFLFAASLENPETCQLVLEIILGCKLPKVKVRAEHCVLVSSEFRSVRMDIYASSEMRVNYNVEAQNENQGNLPKRCRYHQAEMDVASLKPGDNFNDLRPSYVIFICTFDPFGKGLYRYTFEERCLECDIPLGDETCKIFLNTKGTNEADVPEELVHFLRYMEQSTDEYVAGVTEESIIQLHEKVTELKQWQELEERYMTFEEMLRNREEKGKAEGKIEDLLLLLTELGELPETLREQIMAERNPDILKKWLLLAAKATSIEAFMEKM